VSGSRSQSGGTLAHFAYFAVATPEFKIKDQGAQENSTAGKSHESDENTK